MLLGKHAFHTCQKKTPKKTSDLKDAGSLNIFKEMVKKWNIIYIE